MSVPNYQPMPRKIPKEQTHQQHRGRGPKSHIHFTTIKNVTNPHSSLDFNLFYLFKAISCICNDIIIVDNKFGLFVNLNDADYNNSDKVHDIPNIYISNACFTI